VPAYTNGGEKEETERRGQGVEAEFLLSFISSHFRRSPRYQSEFTMYRIYRSDDTSRMVIGMPRREFSRGGRVELVEEREADFLMLAVPVRRSDFGVAKFRVWYIMIQSRQAIAGEISRGALLRYQNRCIEKEGKPDAQETTYGGRGMQRPRKCHEDWLYLVSRRLGPEVFDCRCNQEQSLVVRAPVPALAVPLNPTGITCAGHNMSGSIKIRTVQIKLSLRPMSDREYLPGCELPHVYSRPRCDSRMRRTHPHNWRFE